MTIARRAGVALFAVAFTSIFFLNFCALIYQCGCQSMWAGAADHCNIHAQGRHCPFCSIGTAGSTLVYLWIVIPQVAIAFTPSRLGLSTRLGIAVAAFPLLGSIAAAALGIYKGYWNV